ncbi:MAG: DNA-binding protein WhiA [Bacilli bacterium]|nr:DNA-binding protein WhiA [Bacilli bacterium]
MSYTSKIKDEIIHQDNNKKNINYLLIAFIKYASRIQNNELTFTLENPAIARKIYNLISSEFNIRPRITIRIQKRFKTKQIYILSIKNNLNLILSTCNIKIKDGQLINDLIDLKTNDEKRLYLKGTFLACGSISDPKTSGYHMEFVFNSKKSSDFISNLFHEFNVNSKVIKRTNKYMVYIKVAEEISDALKYFEVNNALFYFEDIRTKKDHINMVNRLNNCEQANQDKTIKTGIQQIKDIEYIKEHDLLSLLDEKTVLIMNYREKYPELSYQELSEVISLETGTKITKSGINHHFIKMRELMQRHKNKNTAK